MDDAMKIWKRHGNETFQFKDIKDIIETDIRILISTKILVKMKRPRSDNCWNYRLSDAVCSDCKMNKKGLGKTL